MATPQVHECFLANNKVTMYDFDPDATTATEVAWVDMRDFGEATFAFFRTIGTGATTLRVLANAASDGSGTDVVIASKTLTAAEPNAVGDYTFQSITAEQIAQEASDAGVAGVRYVCLELSVATNTDEGVALYILSKPRYAYTALTADNIA